MYLSKGNKKMNKGFLIWNLPAMITCPGKTKMCGGDHAICYARKAEIQYPKTLPCRMSNYEETLISGWEDRLIELIKQHIKKSRNFSNFFRIHESGDFYSQEYLDEWKKISAAFPEIHFLSFTKSFKFDYSNAPNNLQVIMSIMPDTIDEAPEGFKKAYAGDCKGINWSKTIECPGLCDTCGMCWQLDKINMDVHFELH